MRPAWPILVGGLLAACGGQPPPCAPATFPDPPLLKVTTDSGALSLWVWTSPQPPVRDCNTVQYEVFDPQGIPVNGLGVDVTPWMPVMGHGASVQPTVTDQGAGLFRLDNVYLAMPGTWQLRTDISGAATDHATPTFQIP